MPRSSFRRYLPDPQKLREHRALKPLGKWLQNPEIWHFHRRSAAGAAFIGLFVIVPAGSDAHADRRGDGDRRALQSAARGRARVGEQPAHDGPSVFLRVQARRVAARHGARPSPKYTSISTGSANASTKSGGRCCSEVLVCGWVAGLTAYALVRVGWRIRVIRHWRERRRKRLARQTAPSTNR